SNFLINAGMLNTILYPVFSKVRVQLFISKTFRADSGRHKKAIIPAATAGKYSSSLSIAAKGTHKGLQFCRRFF
ncbi:MAG: hypothetical protein PHD57_06265, partial [Desulfobacterales bacterium]|nr:hypothetical protein [Desulfobacterales bacterium]